MRSTAALPVLDEAFSESLIARGIKAPKENLFSRIEGKTTLSVKS